MELLNEDGPSAIIKRVLDENIDPNFLDEHGKSPLHWAVITGDLDLIKKLLERGADVHIQDHNGLNPLFALLNWYGLNDTTFETYIPIIDILLEKGLTLDGSIGHLIKENSTAFRGAFCMGPLFFLFDRGNKIETCSQRKIIMKTLIGHLPLPSIQRSVSSIAGMRVNRCSRRVLPNPAILSGSHPKGWKGTLNLFLKYFKRIVEDGEFWRFEVEGERDNYLDMFLKRISDYLTLEYIGYLGQPSDGVSELTQILDLFYESPGCSLDMVRHILKVCSYMNYQYTYDTTFMVGVFQIVYGYLDEKVNQQCIKG